MGYRRLNSVTRKDAYPLPRIDDTLAGSRWFSTLHLLSGSWQVEVVVADREKTAFIMQQGLFEFKVMPFGHFSMSYGLGAEWSAIAAVTCLFR